MAEKRNHTIVQIVENKETDMPSKLYGLCEYGHLYTFDFENSKWEYIGGS